MTIYNIYFYLTIYKCMELGKYSGICRNCFKTKVNNPKYCCEICNSTCCEYCSQLPTIGRSLLGPQTITIKCYTCENVKRNDNSVITTVNVCNNLCTMKHCEINKLTVKKHITATNVYIFCIKCKKNYTFTLNESYMNSHKWIERYGTYKFIVNITLFTLNEAINIPNDLINIIGEYIEA